MRQNLVVDTSIILAIVFDEPHGAWAADQLQQHSDRLLISTVNLTETLIQLHDRRPDRIEELRSMVLSGAIQAVPPDMAAAEIAAAARLRFPINLGDCFAYALSVMENCPILTLDDDFRQTDRPVILP